MKHLDVDASELLPMQTTLYQEKCYEIAKDSQKEPISAIEYLGKYIIADGHHRATAAFIRGDKVKIKTLDTDEELSECNEGGFGMHDSRTEFIALYEQWKSLFEKNGASSIESLAKENLKSGRAYYP